ncbi:acyltransferase family protein [Oribacterium sp. NK2B42]|uniref:acyltransferase family protein n=1 Tax=Oribacterium sp. NK2B42 TaxID=689781 RepID=UPI0003F80BEB|nr:acyltransferase family protein [Oribacterium sp. NK2B42]
MNNMVRQEKLRDSRYELIRIIAMILIMASHCVKFTIGDYGFINQPATFNYIVAMIAIMFGNVGTYLFIILTCWFSTGRVSFKAKRVTKMLWQTWTTCILCILIALVFKMKTINKVYIIRELITPFDTQYWFVTTIVVFTMLLPVLQMVDLKLDNKKIKVICAVLILARPVRAIVSKDLAGDLCDFIACFFIVSYLKREPENWLRKHYRSGLFLYSLFVSILILCKFALPDKLFGLTIFTSDGGGLYAALVRRIRLRTIFQLFGAICAFYALKETTIKPNKTINLIASNAFGVYLWHYNYAFRAIIWKGIFCANYLYTKTYMYIFLIMLGPVMVYLACSIVEVVRKKIFDDYLYEKMPWIQKLEICIDNLYEWNDLKQ